MNGMHGMNGGGTPPTAEEISAHPHWSAEHNGRREVYHLRMEVTHVRVEYSPGAYFHIPYGSADWMTWRTGWRKVDEHGQAMEGV